jgi:hypothetical protein
MAFTQLWSQVPPDTPPSDWQQLGKAWHSAATHGEHDGSRAAPPAVHLSWEHVSHAFPQWSATSSTQV